MAIHSTLITTFGLKYNEYSGAFTNVIDMDDLFDQFIIGRKQKKMTQYG